MIRIENLAKRFKKLQALAEINALFNSGEVVSLIGPNGSGKTTLIKCILGMVKADSGFIYVNGQQINGDPSYRGDIGYMPQIGRYPDNMKVGQLFRMMKNIRKVPETELGATQLYLRRIGQVAAPVGRTAVLGEMFLGLSLS